MLSNRIQLLEKAMVEKAQGADLRRLAMDLEERTRKEETARLFESVNKLRDESCERLDDIGERTFNLRKEVESQLNSVQNATTQLQTRVDQRTLKLEEQSSQASATRPPNRAPGARIGAAS